MLIDPRGRASGRRNRGRPDERLHLDQQRTVAFDEGSDRDARDRLVALADEHPRGIGYLAQAVVRHAETTDLVRRAEPVLRRTQ